MLCACHLPSINTGSPTLPHPRFDVLQRNKAGGSSAGAPKGPLLLDKDVPISAWCCINKGSMAMRVAIDTDSYLPGESLNINAQVIWGLHSVVDTGRAAYQQCSSQTAL